MRPGHRLSFQRHAQRNEFWFVAEGEGEVLLYDEPDDYRTERLSTHSSLVVPAHRWHQLRNTGSTDLRVLEIQYGALCIEEDIERWPEPVACRADELPDWATEALLKEIEASHKDAAE